MCRKPRLYRVQERLKPVPACSRWRKKIRYKTEDEAKEAAVEMARQYRQVFRAYECDCCNGYHVGRFKEAQLD